MALPMERFFVLAEIIQTRREDEVRDDMTEAAFIAWQMAQHQYAAMFQQTSLSAMDEKQFAKFKAVEREFWSEFPRFDAYLRQLGILKDD